MPGCCSTGAASNAASVQRINGPGPSYLGQMRGTVAGSAPTFYAAMLDDGNIVPPVPVRRYAYAPVHHSKEKGSAFGEKKKRKSASRVLGDGATSRAMGGAELKEEWEGSEEKTSN